jgi:hypothetical protein
MTAEQQIKLIRDIGMFVIEQDNKLATRLKVLEAKVAELEAGGIQYHGVHQRGLAYKRGAMVTWDGSAWIAVQDVLQGCVPGEHNGWQLAVKKGRDANQPRKPTSTNRPSCP